MGQCSVRGWCTHIRTKVPTRDCERHQIRAASERGTSGERAPALAPSYEQKVTVYNVGAGKLLHEGGAAAAGGTARGAEGCSLVRDDV